MSTIIRNEISKNNEYWIEKERYLELKHFCMQYSRWKESYEELSKSFPYLKDSEIKGTDISDTTSKIAMLMLNYSDKISLLENIAKETDEEINNYILKAVTNNIPYVTLQMMYGIPCSRDTFYKRYRKFFWILDKRRN